jgi:hypothetical protein
MKLWVSPICSRFRTESKSGILMARYHLYYLRDNLLLGSDNIEASDDWEAARIAKTQGRGELIEIWNAHKRVRVGTPT